MRRNSTLRVVCCALACVAMPHFIGCASSGQMDPDAAMTSERNKTMHSQASDLAHKLTTGAYGDFFVLPAHDQTIDRIWSDPQNRPTLEALVADSSQPLAARFLAAEVLFARDFTFTSRVSPALVADLYARALEQNLTGMANSWGLLYEYADAGPVGVRFVMLGEPAVPVLLRLLDNASSPLIYDGSKEATVGNAYHYRIKDYAAYYLAQIRNTPVTFHRDLAARDQEIAQLKQRLTTQSR